ncbi:unnamed protein product [Closterium sp. Naga37s-1]|nr:unnamed protein product [Closterium sp. Naga37s-1]
MTVFREPESPASAASASPRAQRKHLLRGTGFWRGTVPGLLLVMPYTAIQFVVIHRFKSLMTGSHRTGKLTSPVSYSPFVIPSCLTTFPSPYLSFPLFQDPGKPQLSLDHKQLRPELSFVGGSVAGMAATVGSYPFDLLRTVLASQGEPKSSPLMRHGGHGGVGSYPFDLLRTVLASQGEPKVYAGMRAACMGIVRERGVRGLFAGLPPTMVEIIPYAGLQFGLYDAFKRHLAFGLYDAFKRHLAHYNWSRSKARHDRPVSLAHSHLPSTAPSTAPLSPPPSPSPSSSPSLSPAAAPPAVASAVERAARPAVSSGQLSAWQQFMCGLAAGTLAKVACHPLDVIKKRFQVSEMPFLDPAAKRRPMPSHALPCPPMPPHALPCPPMPSHALPCPPMPSHALPCPPMPSHALPCIPMPSLSLPCPPMSSHALPCPPMPSHALPCLSTPSHASPCLLMPTNAF